MSLNFGIKSSQLVCDISYFSDCEVSIVSVLWSFYSFYNLLFPGRNGDKARDFIFFFLFGMRFSDVIFTLVTPVKTVFHVSAYKEDVSLWCLCTYIYSGASASDWEIMFGIFSYFVLINSPSNATKKRCIQFRVLILNILLKKFFI